MFLVESPTAQLAQLVRPSWIVSPQPRQGLSRLGALTDGGSDGAPFTSRFARCVSRVAGADSRASLAELDHSARVSVGVSPKVVSEQLGHTSAAFTLDVYSHVLPHMQDDAAAKVEAALMG
jgi:integrase